ncbi:C1 family peptidase [[Mycoplasma] testudinis]|uniref:C1 family peptidase n=1 Tax=[Mycoplasma] testudinis TaxID=33924 RepID=UPI000698873A|nr:C1 family peptidase [[Mycoplasma] testudinis]
MATKLNNTLKNEALNRDVLQQWLKEVEKSKNHKLITTAIYHLGMIKTAKKANAAAFANFDFSVNLATQGVTNQFNSGRCWLFAAVNIMREGISKKLNLDGFELSQSYLAFWDKFERCNFYLESIIATIDKPLTDRYVYFFNQEPNADGGQWDMVANVVEKYGVVPKSVMPDSYAAAHTSEINFLVNWMLRDGCIQLRNSKSKDVISLQAIKEDVLAQIFKFLVIAYGEPPQKFDFIYSAKQQIKNSKYKTVYDYKLEKFVEPNLTPLQFYKKHVKPQLGEYVSLIHAPTPSKPMYRKFTFEFLNNVVGGKPIMHHNVSMQLLKYLALETLLEDKPLWFGSDVSNYGSRDTGVWDDQAFDYEHLFDTTFTLNKGSELDLHVSAMNHAMVITGADFDINAFKKIQAQVKKLSGQKALDYLNANMDKIGLTKWKIENSWGSATGKDGYYMMSDSWFNKFVFQLVVDKKKFEFLKKHLNLSSFDMKPINLEPWDPIGTLAK